MSASLEINKKKKKNDSTRANEAHIRHYLSNSIDGADNRNPINAALQMIASWKQRRLTQVMRSAIGMSENNEFDEDTIITSVVKEFESLLSEKHSNIDPYLDDAINEVCDVYEMGNTQDTMPTHIKALDAVIEGWQLGELTIIAADTGLGKSSFVLHACTMQAVKRVPCVLFALEMTKTQCMHKIVANRTGISFFRSLERWK